MHKVATIIAGTFICVGFRRPGAETATRINVNDGLGGASPAVITYGVTEVPNSFLIVNGS